MALKWLYGARVQVKADFLRDRPDGVPLFRGESGSAMTPPTSPLTAAVLKDHGRIWQHIHGSEIAPDAAPKRNP